MSGLFFEIFLNAVVETQLRFPYLFALTDAIKVMGLVA